MRWKGFSRPGLLALAVFAAAIFMISVLSVTGRAGRVVRSLPTELTFKIMLSKWDDVNTTLTKITSARLDVTVNGTAYTTAWAAEGGLMTFNIPTAATSQWTLVAEGFAHRHFRAEFSNGFLYLKNEDRDDRAVNYYELSEGGYAIEYFQDNLYITNQGDVSGPILGQLNRNQVTVTAQARQAAIQPLAKKIEQVAEVDTPGYVYDLVLNGSYLYVADGSGGLRIYDVSDPTNPQAKGTLATSDESIQVGYIGDNIVILGDKSVWRRVDVSDPDNPTSAVGNDFNPDSQTNRIVKNGSELFSAAKTKFEFYTDNNAGAPSLKGSVASNGEAYGLTVASSGGVKYAYLADGDGGLRIYDVSEITRPSSVGSLSAPHQGSTMDLTLSGDYAYLAEGQAGLRIVDISDPTSPKKKSLKNTSGTAQGVFVYQTLCFVANGSKGVSVYDVTSAKKPSFRSRVNCDDSCASVVVDGAYIYMADGSAGFKIFNYSSLSGGDVPEDGFGSSNNPNQEALPPAAVVSDEWQGAINNAANNGSSFSDNRVAGFSFGSEANPQKLARPLAGVMPGLMYQWVYAGGREPDIFFLPIGDGGILPNGIVWQTLFDVNSTGVPLLTLIRTFPPEFLIGLAEGNHTMRYWLLDSEGNASNVREEEIIIE